LFQSEKFQSSKDFDPKKFPRRHVLYDIFLRPKAKRAEPITRDIPPTLVHQLLRFYATFVSADAPVQVPFLSSSVREEIAEQMITVVTQRKVNLGIFDGIAEVALDTLFARCFPRYLTVRGISLPIMKKMNANHKEWEMYLASEEASALASSIARSNSTKNSSSRDSIDTSGSGNSEKIKAAKKSIMKEKSSGLWKLFKKESAFEWKPTRECFVQVLQVPKLYAELKEYVKVF
jgi:hypothetical protein